MTERLREEKTLPSVFARSGSETSVRGAVLVELAIILPLLILFLVGVVNIASILWQLQVVSEAMTSGARKAANLSNDYVACSEVENEAVRAFNAYVTANGRKMGVLLSSAWVEPNVCIQQGTYDGYVRSLVSVQVQTAAADNCILCMGRYLSFIPAHLKRSFALEWTCTGSYTPCS